MLARVSRIRLAKKEEEGNLTLHDIRACRILLKTHVFMRNMLEIHHSVSPPFFSF